jgi:lysine/ornithine N-monooxygenase
MKQFSRFLVVSLFSLLCLPITGFIVKRPVNVIKKVYNDKSIVKIYEPKDLNKKDATALVFYTGANSLIPGDIYSNFISSLNNLNFTVGVVTNNNEVTKDFLQEIKEEYQEIVPISHSSGVVNAVATLNEEKYIKRAIFLDPVDNSKLVNQNFFDFFSEDFYKLNYLSDILVLNAKKSYFQELKFSSFQELYETNKSQIVYEWNTLLDSIQLPNFRLPFIPLFALNLNKLKKINKKINIEKLVANDYGHSDVLDTLWINFLIK